MKNLTHYFPLLASGIMLCSLTMSVALAQGVVATSPGADSPARWFQEDLTPQARFQTSKKEADAAYKEAVIDCKQQVPANRSNCLRDARAQLIQDLESAKKKMSSQHAN